MGLRWLVFVTNSFYFFGALAASLAEGDGLGHLFPLMSPDSGYA